MDEDIDGIPLEKFDNSKGFIPSKWETVDPDQIEAQAITTSKWDTLEPVAPEPPNISQDSDESNDDYQDSGREFDEDKRSRLREIELKLIQYQDEIESGMRSIKTGWTLPQQLEHYRRKLMKKSDKEIRDLRDSSSDLYHSSSTSSRKDISKQRSISPIEIHTKKLKKAKRSRSPSPPMRTTKSSRKSKSPYSRRSARDSISPPKRSSKRNRSRSRSFSESPKHYKSPSPSRTKYELNSPKKYRSPSPPLRVSTRITSSSSSSRQRSPSVRNSTRQIREISPSIRYVKTSPGRHRSDKHKHKHKH